MRAFALVAYLLLASVMAGLTESANDGVLWFIIEPGGWVNITMRVATGLLFVAPLLGFLVYLVIIERRDDLPRRARWM